MRDMRTRTAGFSTLEFLVATSVIAVAAAFLLDRLLYYQEAAEKANMEYWSNVFKLGLQIRIGHLMAQSQVVDYRAVARENPMTWLDAPVPGYRGEFVATAKVEVPGASWYYDRTRRELIYVAAQSRYLQPDAQRQPRVHFQVKLVHPDGVPSNDDVVLGVQIVPVQPYRWF
jgi:general secretion pathway protein G